MSAKVASRRLRARALRLARRIDDSRVVNQARLSPGLAAWCLLWALLLPQLRVWRGPLEPTPPRPSEQQVWLQQRAEQAVNQVLRVIGHDVSIDEIEAQPLEPSIAGQYWDWGNRIVVSTETPFSRNELLDTMAHECVHAIFDQAYLRACDPSVGWPYCRLIEETAAYVLGAHIAGLARTRDGGDGRALTEKLVHKYRDSCDPTNPDSMHQKVAASHGTDDECPPDVEFSISFHFGSTRLVDEIDAICRENPEPWDAARVIAATYLWPDGVEPGGYFW